VQSDSNPQHKQLNCRCPQNRFFSQEAALHLILGKNNTIFFVKREEKEFNFWGKLHDLKEFFFGRSCP
jgi:hypothetical protein